MGDGESVFLAIQNEREWLRFCERVLEQPELATDARFVSNADRVENREALFQVIESVFLAAPPTEILDRLVGADIAHGEVNGVLDFVRHPQLAARDRWREIESPVGKLSALVPPATIDGVETVMGPVPEVGADTDRILSDIGYGAEDIAALRKEEII